MPRRPRSRSRYLAMEALESRRLMALDPTASEQELMQLTNRFRSDPQNEFSRLIASVSPRRAHDGNVDFSLAFFGTDVSIVQAELAALTPVPPLAWDATAQQVAQDYLPFMAANKSSAHTLDGPYQQRIGRYPFDFTLGGTARENTFINAFSAVHTHAAYVIDWGQGPGGIQPARGHRANLINGSLKIAGMAFAAVTYEPATGFGPTINAQELIGLGVTKPKVTGAIFEDRNASTWYDAGEGLGGVQITFQGAAGQFTTRTMSAGGYDLEIPPGVYTATASGGGLRFPLTVTNVVMATQNVWLNFIYDQSNVPADALESNNSAATATLLTGNDQVVANATIHRGDVDFFRLDATTSGPLRVALQFTNSFGNLDLRLLDGAGNTLVLANSTTDLEMLSSSVVSGRTYYIVVESPNEGSGGPYTLDIDVPVAQAPIARNDSATSSTEAGPILIAALDNDIDPDAPIGQAQIVITAAGAGQTEVVLVAGQRVLRYTPAVGFSGVDRIAYTLTDSQGLTSPPAIVEVMVIDFAAPRPFHNAGAGLDVSDDGAITAIDALLIINQLNIRPGSALPGNLAGALSLFGFVDVNGNGTLEPLDVLLVINRLNTPGLASGEAESMLAAARDDYFATWEVVGSPPPDLSGTETRSPRVRSSTERRGWLDSSASRALTNPSSVRGYRCSPRR